MKKYLVILLFLSLSFGCIHAQDSLDVSTRKANVYIIRNNFTNVVNVLSKHDFYNNDNYIGSLKGFEYMKYECNSGKQLFWATSENKDFLELDFKPGETYIIKANYPIGIMNGRVKLKLVTNGSDEYNRLEQKILSRKPVQFTLDQIQKKNIQRKSFILKSLAKYNSKKKELSFRSDSFTSTLPIAAKANSKL
jgi:hypothetical protein